MKSRLTILAIGLVLVFTGTSVASGVGDVEIHLNGGADVAYIGDTNIVEIWIKNDAQLTAISMGFEFSIGCNYSFDPAHGSGMFAYAKPVGDAASSFDLFHTETAHIDNVSTDSILISGVSMVSNFPVHSTHVKCYTLAVYIPPGQPELLDGFCVDNIFIPPGGSWTFAEVGGYSYAPDFQGNGNTSQSDPDAPPACFDVVAYTGPTVVPTPPGFTYIPGVPDWNQPPASGATNYCAPVSALNIVDYWQSSLSVPGLVDPADAGVYPTASATADFIGYFMGTNGVGSPNRWNSPEQQGFPSPGTFFFDQAPGLAEYIAWNTNNQYDAIREPALPPWKIGYSDTTVILHTGSASTLFGIYIAEIDEGKPVKIDFNYWNPIYSDTLMIDDASGDTAFVHYWGPNPGGSGGEDPEEDWYADVGHAVTGVGYIPNWNGVDYAIVHDNWPTTRSHILIPWSNLMAMVTADPPSADPDTVVDCEIQNPSYELGTLGQIPTYWVEEEVAAGPNVATVHDMKSVNTNYHEGERSLYMYAKCTDGGTAASYSALTYAWTQNWIDCEEAATVRLRIRGISTSHYTYWGWGTHILLMFTDGTNTVAASSLFDRGEGYDNNFYDSTGTGADGSQWFVYDRQIPEEIDKSHMKIAIRCHAGAWSWSGWSVSLGFYVDNLELLTPPDTVLVGRSDHETPIFPKTMYFPIYLNNYQEIEAGHIPLEYNWYFDPDSVSFVCTRLDYMDAKPYTIDSTSKVIDIGFFANLGSGNGPLSIVDDYTVDTAIARIYFTIPFDEDSLCDTTWISPPDTTTIELALDTVRLALVDADGDKSTPDVVFDSILFEHYRPGDVNGDGKIDIDDIVYLVAHIFMGGPPPVCGKSGDANGDGQTDIDDVVYLINYIFLGGPPPIPTGYVPDCDEPQPSPKMVSGSAELTAIETADDRQQILSFKMNADRAVQAVQLNLAASGDVRDVRVRSLVEGIDELHGVTDGKLTIGLLNLFGEAMIPAEEAEIVRVTYRGDGEIELLDAIAVAEGGGRLTTVYRGVQESMIPKSYALHQNFPNPFNPATNIAFSLPSASHAVLDVFNIMGRKVATITDEYLPAGDHTVIWSGTDYNGEPVASGVYFYRLRTGDFSQTRKMLLLK